MFVLRGFSALVKFILGETGVPYEWEYGDRAIKSQNYGVRRTECSPSESLRYRSAVQLQGKTTYLRVRHESCASSEKQN